MTGPIGGSRGLNGHAPHIGSKPTGQNRPNQKIGCFFHNVHVHQIFCHLILRNCHHEILLCLVLSIGLAPDFDYLGPYQFVVCDLLGVGMP